MTDRFRAGRAAVLALAAILAGSTVAAAAPPKPSFATAVRLGFPNGDDWEPSIAADRYGHVYAFWTHYIGYGGAATGDPDPSCADCGSPHMDLQISADDGATWTTPNAPFPTLTRQDDPVDPTSISSITPSRRSSCRTRTTPARSG